MTKFSIAQLVINKLDGAVNTDTYGEVGPVLSEDGKTIYFTRVSSPDYIQYVGKHEHDNLLSRSLKSIYTQIAGRQIDDPIASDYNQDIWVANLNDRLFTTKIAHPEYPLNNAYPNSVCSILPGSNSIVVLNKFDDDGLLQDGFSTVQIGDSDQYGFPTAMNILNYEDIGDNANMSISRDEQHLFISMKRTDSKGGNDLYMSVKIGDNTWGKPKPLRGSINTRYNETSPFISKDKTVLIFSSNRPGGHGGQDLYISKRLDYSYMNWSEPVLLESPINGPSDDFHAYMSDDMRYLFFASNRDGTSDIFYTDLDRGEMLPQPFDISLRIIDGISKEETRGSIYWKDKYVEEFEGFFRAYNGEFTKTLTRNTPFVFEVRKRGYKTEKLEVDPWDLVIHDISAKEFEVIIYPIDYEEEVLDIAHIDKDSMAPIDLDNPEDESNQMPKKEKEYTIFSEKGVAVMSNIYFQKGTAIVLSNSLPAIQSIVEELNNHPNLHILIEGHTDNVGPPAPNRILSQERADAIKSHLLIYGIDKERIYTIGKGPDFPLNGNETEEEREANRRVEIKILKE